jgi:hypothetical protein
LDRNGSEEGFGVCGLKRFKPPMAQNWTSITQRLWGPKRIPKRTGNFKMNFKK